MTKHTKGEWYVCENGHVREVDTDYVICTPGDGGHIDDDIILIPPTEQEANAQFIVKAVNAHEELVEACTEALNMVKNCSGNWPMGVTEKLGKALAKANHE